MKNKRPSASSRAERRNRKKMINNGFNPVDNGDRGSRVKFSSLTFGKVRDETMSSTFIVRTRKPLRWGDFIEIVSKALEEVV